MFTYKIHFFSNANKWAEFQSDKESTKADIEYKIDEGFYNKLEIYINSASVDSYDHKLIFRPPNNIPMNIIPKEYQHLNLHEKLFGYITKTKTFKREYK
jgi:hypothetical protein